MTDNEKFYPIPDLPGYSITRNGVVRKDGRPACANSQLRKDRKNYIEPSIPSQWLRAGYPSISIRINNEPLGLVVHRLVAKTFIPNPENKPFVNHKNGIKTDNRVENLEWVTAQENCRHAVFHGLTPAGSKHRWSKLSEAQVDEIREQVSNGAVGQQVAKKFGVCKGAVYAIMKGKNWGKTINA